MFKNQYCVSENTLYAENLQGEVWNEFFILRVSKLLHYFLLIEIKLD